MIEIFLKYWAIVLLIFISGLILWPLFLPGYFSHHDDLQVMRIFEMRRCLIDFQIPCRWVPDMGYGNGFPLFNYYSALPYYFGAILSFLLGYIWAAKTLFFIPLFCGGLFMYLLGKELFGKLAGIVVAVLFLFAPYRALDSYVRGAVAESFALALAPLVFYFVLRLIKEKSLKNFLGVSISSAAFLTSHNIMTLLFIPVLFLWSLYFLYMEKTKNLKSLVLSLILGFGLAAFFIIPAFFEKSLVQTDTLIRMDFNYRANFVTFNQLFLSRFWGYGASMLGSNDTISFQIGWPHWWLIIFVLLVLFVKRIHHKFQLKETIFFIFLLIIFIFSLFMIHNKSAFIWEKIDILKYTQFPWRFLSLTIFSASLIGGFLINIFKNNQHKYVVGLVILLLTIFLNWSFFKPEIFYLSLTDQEKLSGILWEDQQKAAILDYLPKTAYEPREKAPTNPILVSGEAIIKDFSNMSNRWNFEATVIRDATIELPVFDFPNWQVKVNDLSYPHSHQNYMGRISVDLSPGVYKVDGYFGNTPIRTSANIISIVSLGILLSSNYGKIKKFLL